MLKIISFFSLGIPKGVINIVYGKGDVLGRALAEHTKVNGVAFVSNVENRRRLYRPDTGKKCSMHISTERNQVRKD